YPRTSPEPRRASSVPNPPPAQLDAKAPSALSDRVVEADLSARRSPLIFQHRSRPQKILSEPASAGTQQRQQQFFCTGRLVPSPLRPSAGGLRIDAIASNAIRLSANRFSMGAKPRSSVNL